MLFTVWTEMCKGHICCELSPDWVLEMTDRPSSSSFPVPTYIPAKREIWMVLETHLLPSSCSRAESLLSRSELAQPNCLTIPTTGLWVSAFLTRSFLWSDSSNVIYITWVVPDHWPYKYIEHYECRSSYYWNFGLAAWDRLCPVTCGMLGSRAIAPSPLLHSQSFPRLSPFQNCVWGASDLYSRLLWGQFLTLR